MTVYFCFGEWSGFSLEIRSSAIRISLGIMVLALTSRHMENDVIKLVSDAQIISMENIGLREYLYSNHKDEFDKLYPIIQEDR